MILHNPPCLFYRMKAINSIIQMLTEHEYYCLYVKLASLLIFDSQDKASRTYLPALKEEKTNLFQIMQYNNDISVFQVDISPLGK